MNPISNLFDSYLKDIKVTWRETLFEPNWDALKVDRCPICGNKLKYLRDKNLAICHGKKHKKSFIISKDRLQRIKEIDYSKKILPYKNM